MLIMKFVRHFECPIFDEFFGHPIFIFTPSDFLLTKILHQFA